MADVVLDASAVLALLQAEPGGDRVETLLLDQALSVLISALNYSEVFDRLLRYGVSPTEADRRIGRLGMDVVDFDVDQARLAALYRVLAPSLSLADRACLAVGERRAATVWTADRFWKTLQLDLPIELIRP